MSKREVAPDPEHFLKMLVNFHKAQPTSMTQSEFEDHLKHTTVSRYKKTMDLMAEVKAEIESNRSQLGDSTATEMIEKIEDGLAAAAYGSMRYNSTLTAGMNSRAELWYKPANLYDADIIVTED